jgi:hypothetical protein
MLVLVGWTGITDRTAACRAGLGVMEALLRLGPLLPHQAVDEGGGLNPGTISQLAKANGLSYYNAFLQGFVAKPAEALADVSVMLVRHLMSVVLPLGAVAFPVDEDMVAAAFCAAISACKHEWVMAAPAAGGAADAAPAPPVASSPDGLAPSLF